MKYTTLEKIYTHPDFHSLMKCCLAEVMVGINMKYTERTPDGRLLAPKLTIGDQKLFDWATKTSNDNIDIYKYSISLLSTYPKDEEKPDEISVSFGKYGEVTNINFAKNYPIVLSRIRETQAYNAWAMIDPDDWTKPITNILSE